MSAKKSFDVRRRSAKDSAPKRRRITKSLAKRTPTRTRKKTLRERREGTRQAKGFLVFALCMLIVGAVLYLLWRPEVRIAEVRSTAPSLEASIERIALQKMEGAYYLLFPKDSFFFYPEREIEEAILEAYPQISRTSISRMNFTALHVELKSRSTAFLWCGEPAEGEEETRRCFEADEYGFVFASAVDTDTATATEPLLVYAKLDTASTSETYPLRSRVIGTKQIPNILRFSKILESLGTPLRSIAIRGDEADIFTKGDTRVTYVVGKEREATEDARVTLPTLNLMDGSIDYVDLRFPGKVYIKRSGE